MKTAFVVAALVLSSGCTTVEPYQRAYLARPDMGFEPTVGTAKALDKTYPSKEMASGGGSVGGGGCGCN
jgi:Domain of unknown function (DUF4266)